MVIIKKKLEKCFFIENIHSKMLNGTKRDGALNLVQVELKLLGSNKMFVSSSVKVKVRK